MRLVRDPESAAGVDQPERRAGRQGEPAGGADRRRDVRDERPCVEDVRRAEGVEPEQVQVRRGDRAPRRLGEVRGVHPELAGPVVADEADPLEPGVLRDRRPQQDRLDPARVRRDRLEACQLAGRLDGDRADPGRDRRGELVVALARAGHHDPIRGDPRPARGHQLAAGGDIGPEPQPAEELDDREGRVRLDRVGEVDPRRQDGLERRHLALDDVEVVDVERRPEVRRQVLRRRARRAAPRGGSRCAPAADRDAAGRRARGSSEGAFERDPRRGPGVAILDQQRDRRRTARAAPRTAPWRTRDPGMTTASGGTASGASDVPSRIRPRTRS